MQLKVGFRNHVRLMHEKKVSKLHERSTLGYVGPTCSYFDWYRRRRNDSKHELASLQVLAHPLKQVKVVFKLKTFFLETKTI